MGKKKKVTAPTYDTMQENEWISGLRNDIGNYRDYTNNILENLNVMSPEVQSKLQGLADDYTAAQWSDLNRSFLKNSNALNQRNYNRFGSLGSTGALYGQESLQRDYNDLASRVASNTASKAQDLFNNYFQQQANAFNAGYNLYNLAGSNIYDFDKTNWQIGNLNKEAQFMADVQNAQNSGNWLSSALGGAGTGATIGSAFGPIGALVGAGVGAIGGGIAGSQGYNIPFTGFTNMSGGSSGGSLFSSMFNKLGSSNSTTGADSSLGGGFSLNTKYNPSSWKLSWQ